MQRLHLHRIQISLQKLFLAVFAMLKPQTMMRIRDGLRFLRFEKRGVGGTRI